MKKLLISALLISAFSFQQTIRVKAEDTFFDASTMLFQAQERDEFTAASEEEHLSNSPIDFKDISDFATAPFKLDASTEQIPVSARLRIEVEDSISAASAKLGDDFKAKVIEDFYYQKDNLKKLIVPKDSWIRGKVSFLKKPRFLSRSGKLEINLDTLVTPQGDYIPLDAKLSFVEGVVNEKGLLDPQTGFTDKAVEPTEALLSSNTGKAVSIATLGLPVAGSLIGGSVIALFSKGDSAAVVKGQELQILITKSIDIGI